MKDAEKKAHSFADFVKQMDQLHRLMLDVIKDEFARLSITDITAVQALILYNLGDSEVTAVAIKTVGNYQGSNHHYSQKRLVDNGYLHQARCDDDRRSVLIRLTPRGQEIRKVIADLFEFHQQRIQVRGIDLTKILHEIQCLQTSLKECIRYIY